MLSGEFPKMPYLYGPTQVDACFNGHIVGGLEEGPLQEQGEEEQHGQHICILKKLFGRNEIDPQQSHLEGSWGDDGIDPFIIVSQARQSHRLETGFDFLSLLNFN